MMLRTSLRNENPAFNMFKFTLRKNIGLVLLLCAATLLLSPGCIILDIQSTFIYDHEYEIERIYDFFVGWSSIAAGVAVVIFNIINFMFLYSKKAGDVFHSLPLKRSELLISRAFSGVVSTLIPVTLGFLALLGVALFMPGVNGSASPIIIGYFYAVMTVFVSSAISVLFIVCAGTVFDFLISFIGANGGMLLAGYIICFMLENLLKGYDESDYVDVLKNISPLFYCGWGIGDCFADPLSFGKEDIFWFIRTIIYTVGFFGVSIVLYNHRKSERCGEAYAYKFIYVLCSLIAGFCGAYLGGMIFTDGQGEWNIIFWIGALATGIITTVAYRAISERGFKRFKKSIVLGLGSFGIMVLIAVLSITGMFGFTSRVPAKNKIDKVEVREFNEDIIFTDPTLVLDLHKAIVNTKDSLVGVGTPYDGSYRTYVYLTYYLDNGKTMNRTFKVERESVKEELFNIYSSKERFDTIRDNVKQGDPEHFSIFIDNRYNVKGELFSDTDYYNAVINTEEFLKIVDIYEKELRASSSDIIMTEELYYIDISWQDKDYGYYDLDLRMDSSFVETIDYIQSLDLPSRMEK